MREELFHPGPEDGLGAFWVTRSVHGKVEFMIFPGCR